jgi:hypothetical protein
MVSFVWKDEVNLGVKFNIHKVQDCEEFQGLLPSKLPDYLYNRFMYL